MTEAAPPRPAAPPGWYPDPAGGGGERYWDGSTWTQHAARHSSPAAGDPSGQWALAAHGSALLSLFVGFNFLGPLVVYLIKRDGDPLVREHAAEALNFNLSAFIYLAVGTGVVIVLSFVLIGLLLIPLLALGAALWLVLVVIGTVKASRGELYRYPLTIRFVD